MKQATRKRQVDQKSSFVDTFAFKRLREGLLILMAAFSVFLLLSMFSYSSGDPGWSNTGHQTTVNNLGGLVGAWLSDVFLYMSGYVAYFIPILLTYSAWTFAFYFHSDEKHPTMFVVLKVIGVIAIIAATTALFSLFVPGSSHIPFTSGGVLGNLLGYALVHVLNVFGATLCLMALLLTGLTLYAGISWAALLEKLGQHALRLAHEGWQRFITRNDNDFAPESEPVKKVVKQRREPRFVAAEKPEAASAKKRTLEISRPTKVKPSQRSVKSQQTELFRPADGGGEMPSIGLLDAAADNIKTKYSNAQLESMSSEVELRLTDFGVEAKVVAVHPGPVVTRFELQLAAGTKVSKISGLSKDLARSLSVISVRVVEVIPGKSVIGLELPNVDREIVRLREVLASQQYDNARSPLSLALGKDIAGHPVIVDLAKMPHLLVAGTTGSGKSVGVNAMLLSLLYKSSPDKLRMILIDPKMLELAIYDGVPHLLTPVVTDMKDAANALRWCVNEMERRYRLMASLGVRNIVGYNNKVEAANKDGAPLLDPLWQDDMGDQQPELEPLPFIVVVIDEFADMMMVVGKKVEELIARIAQKARAAGIHLVLATQRPSVDVITGLIKANVPTRIAFQVSSKIDSRTIIDQAGADQLLGHGDMLYLAPGTGVPMRVHGAFVDDDEVHRVVKDWKKRGSPEYIDAILEGATVPGIDEGGSGGGDSEQDALYDQAVQIVLETKRASISNVQRRLKVGYNRAARMVEAMEAAGLVSPMDSNGSREILVPTHD